MTHRIADMLIVLVLAAASASAQDAPPRVPEPFPDPYGGKQPAFLSLMRSRSGYGFAYRGWERTDKQMRLSSEPAFYTLNVIEEDARAYALVAAGKKKEAQGEYREALKVYQQVIEKYPYCLYRVSKFGIFVPITQYCQRRILSFPPADLAHYRTQYDARAKEAFEQARRQYSLLGLSDIVDTMLATSYGGKAILELGNAALDTGHYLAALEYFTTVRDHLPDKDLQTADLALKIAHCRRMLGEKDPKAALPAGAASRPDVVRLKKALGGVKYEKPPFFAQRASEPNPAANDYAVSDPVLDPLGLTPPVWEFTLPGSRRDLFVFTQPVVTNNSIVYRHKNIIYCRSILNGSLRWVQDVGGRAVWQNKNERQYPQERVLVQDGMVFTPISKAGPSLAALDEVTGEIKWAYGPMVASTPEEARMRFEAAPTGGPRTVFAGYVLDNIEGDTHTDSEYGVIAFDSSSGRIHWRQRLCRLAPGKFTAGFAEKRRNRIRSFTSPPLYHQGTVYYNTNAGVVAAMDALSGRVKWLMRYPYYPGIHDATRQFGRTEKYYPVKHHGPMFWYNQRPLLIGERLFVLPVDTRMMLCIDRRSGKNLWTRTKGSVPDRNGRLHEGGITYLLGPTTTGELVATYSHRAGQVQTIDPATGKTLWRSGDCIAKDTKPILKHNRFTPYGWSSIAMNNRWYCTAARPFLDKQDRVHLPQWAYVRTGSYGGLIGWSYHLGGWDLRTRKILPQRRYLSGEILSISDRYIRTIVPGYLKSLEEIPHKDANTTESIRQCKEVIADTVPENEHGPFMPYSRTTFSRYGVPYELRFGPRKIALVYDRAKVRKAIAARKDPAADFARAELTVADGQLKEASRLLKHCLATISSEDLDFRAAINQQLYRVHKRLARRAIRAGRRPEELDNALGMSRTASTLPEEIETLFAVAEAFERQGKVDAAAGALRTIIATYGHHEYPINPLMVAEQQKVLAAATGVLDHYKAFVKSSIYADEMTRSLELMKRGLPLYLSTVSPLPKTLTSRAGELAARKLMVLQQTAGPFAAANEKLAVKQLAAADDQERLTRLWEFPATTAAQEALDDLFGRAAKMTGPEARLRMWRLADAARVSGLKLPAAYRDRVTAPAEGEPEPVLDETQEARKHAWQDVKGSARLVLERRGDRSVAPHLLLIGARVRKRLDNKFTLAAMDLRTAKTLWQTPELRLKGRGQEPGFFEAFVHGDLVIVHGLYDVLAFTWADGKLKWRYRVPFDFEIRHTLLTGDLMILAGATETLALYVETESKVGEVAWQVQEMGDLYIDPYMTGDRLISVRKLPYSATVRYRATGKLIGRLALPDLSEFKAHPLIEKGPKAVPAAHAKNLLIVTDGWYYILVDTDRLAVRWKRLIDTNDVTREPPLRFAVSEKYLTVLKQDYDQKTIYMLSAETGEVLWRTEPKVGSSPRPMHSVLFDGEACYGIVPHAGQGFYFVGRESRGGKLLFSTEITGYQSRPTVSLLSGVIGKHVAVLINDRQQFEVRLFDVTNGKCVLTLVQKGVPPFGSHGRVSGTIQNGRIVLLSKDKLSL